MEIIDHYLNQPDPIEPETLSMLGISDSLDRQKIMVVWLIKHDKRVFEDFMIFENCIMVLDGIEPNVEAIEAALPKTIWTGVAKMIELSPTSEFSHEVKMYIKFQFNNHGIYFYPPGSGIPDTLLPLILEYIETHNLVNVDDIPDSEEDALFTAVQAAEYLKLTN
jgi:hypothetical protein